MSRQAARSSGFQEPASAELPTRRRRDRLSRRGRGRADRAGARLCLQRRGQLGRSRAGSQTLTRAGRRVIALDNRGHGASSKLYDPAAYHSDLHGRRRARAARSSRSRRAPTSWAIRWARASPPSSRLQHPAACAQRHFRRARHPSGRRASGCPGRSRMRWKRASLDDGAAMPSARMFRAFAEQTKSDLRALAACIRGSRQTLDAARRSPRSALPVLVAVGSQGRDRRLRAGAGGAACRPARRSRFPAATTCWRSATRCSSRACWTSWRRGPDRASRPVATKPIGRLGHLSLYGRQAAAPVLRLC